MKKLLFLVLTATLALSLSACNFGKDPECVDPQVLNDEGVCVDPADTEAPVLTGVVDQTIYLNATFNPLAGVKAMDNKDGDITSSIVVAGTVDTTRTGVTYLLYTVEDAAGNKSQASRNITVEVDPSTIGDEMVPNGDFSQGNALWIFEAGGLEGGTGSFAVTDGVGEVTIATASWNAWEPRLRMEGIDFENGKTYEITFDAKAAAVRSINVQVGEVLSAAPWFTDFKQGQSEVFDLTTEFQTFTFKFTMNLDTNDNGSLIFEHGTVTGGVGTDNLATTVYYDNIAIVESTPDADVTAPVFSGVEDVIIEVDDTFDPLAGVTAFDVVDQDITLTAANVTGTVDTSTEGEYTLTYTVTDAAGNTATETRKVTVVGLIFNDTTLVVNGNFEAAFGDPAEWILYEANWDPVESPMTDGTMSIVDGKLVLEVVNIGTWGNQGWLLQAMQKVEFVKGETYKVTFDASAAAARDISIAIGFSDDANNWHGYLTEVVTLGTDMATYEFIFTVLEDNMSYDDLLKFEFGQANDTVTIDNVKVQILAQPETVMNADFEDYGWYTWSKDALFWPEDPETNLVNITKEIINGEFKVTYDAIGDHAWYVQVFQEGYNIENGKTYQVSFDAYADVARSINGVMIAGAEYRETIAITDAKATYTFTFTATADNTNGKVDFELSKVLGTETAGWVILDNVKVEEYDGSAVVADTNQTVNGGFDPLALEWATWSEQNGSSIQVVDGAMEITTGALGSANWAVQVFQDGVELVPGATYTLMFDAKASVARDMNFVLITNVENRETFSLTTDMQTFTYTFVYNGTNSSGKVDFELGNISAASVEAVVTIDNVMLFRDFSTVLGD